MPINLHALFWLIFVASIAIGVNLLIRFFTHRTDRPKTSDYVSLLGICIAAGVGLLGIIRTDGGDSPTPAPAPTPAVVVPDVILLPRSEAIAQLDTAGLAAAVICETSPSVEATGVVFATTPAAFQRVEPGAEVTIYVNPTCE